MAIRKYGKTINKILADNPNRFSENRYKLACTQCGKNAEYDGAERGQGYAS